MDGGRDGLQGCIINASPGPDWVDWVSGMPIDLFKVERRTGGFWEV